jgi:hypothetical protein
MGSGRRIASVRREKVSVRLSIGAFRAHKSCLSAGKESGGLTYFSKGIEKTQLKRDHKAALLASVRADLSEPSHGMTKEEAITILMQDIADYDEILARLRSHDDT